MVHKSHLNLKEEYPQITHQDMGPMQSLYVGEATIKSTIVVDL